MAPILLVDRVRCNRGVGRTIRLPAAGYGFLRWFQRLLAMGLILTAGLGDNPAFGNFELSAVLFSFLGATWQFALLGVFLAAGLFVKRPWCLSLCPVKPVLDYMQALGRWVANRRRGQDLPAAESSPDGKASP